MNALRCAVRSLSKSPGYTAIALLTLAFGIGVNTSMFSVMDALLFRSGPFPRSEELVQPIANTQRGDNFYFSAPEIREMEQHVSSLVALTTIDRTQFVVAESGQPAERLPGIAVSKDFFATFGTQPMLGRAFTPEEYLPGNNHVVLLSYTCWQQRYGGAPDIIGRTLRLDGQPVTVIGVMPETFEFPLLWGGAAMWRPLNYNPGQVNGREYRSFILIGRLDAGASVQQATAELAPLAALQEADHPESYPSLRYRVVPLHEALMDKLGRKISWMLLGLSGFVLLIACANLANLQLARATANLRDLAIRAALGASRTRLIVQQLAESMLLAAGGGLLGVVVAFAINRVIDRNFMIGGSPDGLEIAIDEKILALTLLLSLLTGLLCGILPAWFASRTDLTTALKQQGRGSTSGRGLHRMRRILIISEVALAFVLLAGATIMQRGFAQLLEDDPGWDSERILTAALPIPQALIATEEARIEFFRKLESRLRALPGVEHAALATSLPIFSHNSNRTIFTENQTAADAARLPIAFHVMVTPDYFATLGIHLVEGRLFPAEIDAKDPSVIVVNESLARLSFPGRSAIGQRLASLHDGQTSWAEIIGVVRDVDTAASTNEPLTKLHVYKPLVHESWPDVQIVVRSHAPAALAEAVRRTVNEISPDLATARMGTVRQIVAQQQHNLYLAGKTLTWFAVLGLALASIGLYGVISNIVALRTGEFGIRLALGAQPSDVIALVFSYGMRLTGVGLVLGIAGAYLLSRLLRSMMPRIVTIDLLTFSGVVVVLFCVAVVACWIPARRATKVDPLVALRAE